MPKNETEVDRTKLTPSEDLELAMLEAHEELSAKQPEKKGEPKEEEESEEASAKDETQSEGEQDEKKAKASQEESSQEAGDDEADEEEDDDDEAPQSWEKKKAKLWKELPKEARSYWKQREGELTKLVHQKASEYDRGLKSIETIINAVEPYRKAWGVKAMTVEQGIVQALALKETLEKADKFELAKRFLKASGKSAQDLIEQQKDPNFALRDELESVKRKLEDRDQQESEASTRATRNELARAYNAFATTKTESGEDKYPSCQVPAFAKAMGSLVIELAAEFPGSSYQALVEESYKRLGGQIQTASPQPRSPNQTKKLKTAITSSFAKGKSTTSKSTFDDTDDAWAATFQEHGLID